MAFIDPYCRKFQAKSKPRRNFRSALSYIHRQRSGSGERDNAGICISRSPVPRHREAQPNAFILTRLYYSLDISFYTIVYCPSRAFISTPNGPAYNSFCCYSDYLGVIHGPYRANKCKLTINIHLSVRWNANTRYWNNKVMPLVFT